MKRYSTDTSQMGAVMLTIGWVIALGLVGWLLHLALYESEDAKILRSFAGTQIILYREYDSHFRIEGKINQVPVTFLIDTGATSVAVPQSIAEQAGLKKLHSISAHTASGIATGYGARAKQIEIAGIPFRNKSIIIMPTMPNDQVLLGMNVLQHFNIEYSGDSLVLTFSHDDGG